jgi:hypothetical protein
MSTSRLGGGAAGAVAARVSCLPVSQAPSVAASSPAAEITIRERRSILPFMTATVRNWLASCGFGTIVSRGILLCAELDTEIGADTPPRKRRQTADISGKYSAELILAVPHWPQRIE